MPVGQAEQMRGMAERMATILALIDDGRIHLRYHVVHATRVGAPKALGSMVPTIGDARATSSGNMTELAEPARVTEQSAYHDGTAGSSRLVQVAAAVGIVAGVVFVVAVVFFTGFFLGGYGTENGGPGAWHPTGRMGPGGHPGTCPMMKGGGMTGPDQMSPGGMTGPSSSGTTTVPRPLGP